jgi:hypothetical protein
MSYRQYIYDTLIEIDSIQKRILFIIYFIIRMCFLFLKGLYTQAEGKGFCMGDSYLRLSKTSEKFADGTFKCKLELFDEGGKEVREWIVCTGQGYAQHFRKAGRNMPGSMEPCPQGTYAVWDISWAGGKDNWKASHGAGLGPVFIPIVCAEEKRRGEFGIHMDYNRSTAPGTAGCVGVIGEKDMRDIVDWLRKLDPKILKVDWGL